jgi:hypothetical protein
MALASDTLEPSASHIGLRAAIGPHRTRWLQAGRGRDRARIGLLSAAPGTVTWVSVDGEASRETSSDSDNRHRGDYGSYGHSDAE